jgi:hypothetical protein
MSDYPGAPSTKLPKTPSEAAADPRYRWTSWVAVGTAVLAALAAIAGLLTGHHTDAAMIDQIQASDQWSYYQAKGIKAAVLAGKIEMLPALGREPTADDRERLARYEREQKEIEAVAKGRQDAAADHRRRHDIVARGATLFQIAIALSAISLLTKRNWFWYLSLVMGLGGVVFLIQCLLPA